MVTRRQFFKYGGAAGATLLLARPVLAQTQKARRRGTRPPRRRVGLDSPHQVPGGTLDPNAIPKYQTPLLIPPAMPQTAVLVGPGGSPIDYYEIAMRQRKQQILPAGLPATTVWSYGSVNHPSTFNSPSFTFEAQAGRTVRVKWINDLKDPATGKYLPHLLPVDQTVHWANPAGLRDSRTKNPAPYRGPVPMVTHVHGAHAGDESDGYAEAWFLPAATDIPAGYGRYGTWYTAFKNKAKERFGVDWEPGTATFQYSNDQRAATLWYHDHALGMTRLNVYAGPAGFYLLRGGPDDLAPGILPGPAPARGDAPGTRYYEIPIAIQDRSFNADGSLFFPASRQFFDGFAGPYIPDSDISPIFNPEFFGNTMMVNGYTWPVLDVEPRRYRFRLLNGCNARTLMLKFNNPAIHFWQIGAEGGFLPQPVERRILTMMPGERADVIVDFTGLTPGSPANDVILLNVGPDEPYGGGAPDVDFVASDPNTTGQVMKLRIVALNGPDTSTPVASLTLPALTPLGAASLTRQVSLNELDSALLPDVGPREAMLGTVDTSGPEPMGMPMMWLDTITENPELHATEVWEIYNFTMDSHPIHVHQVMFQVVNREVFDPLAGPVGHIDLPEPWETGFKDTVIANPGQITRIRMKFDLPGLYVWHCHIVDHEDHEMMRPYAVGPIPAAFGLRQFAPFIGG